MSTPGRLDHCGSALLPQHSAACGPGGPWRRPAGLPLLPASMLLLLRLPSAHRCLQHDREKAWLMTEVRTRDD
jgi:hypothetical protein